MFKRKKEKTFEQWLIETDGKEINYWRDETFKLIKENNKYKEVLDKIKEKLQSELDNYNVTMGRAEKIELLELLEEIE